MIFLAIIKPRYLAYKSLAINPSQIKSIIRNIAKALRYDLIIYIFNSPFVLNIFKEVAKRERYEINLVKADMTKPLPFEDEAFDLIFHPVSNCYIEDVVHVWKECYRILKKGGILLAGLDNGINFIFDDEEEKLMNKLPFNPLKDKELYEKSLKNDWGIQFSHTIEEQIGGQLQAGFILTDIFEDINGQGRLHDFNVPTFYATRAVKK